MRAAPEGEVGRVTCLRVRTLGAGTVYIEPIAVHVAGSPAKGDVNSGSGLGVVIPEVGGAGPEPRKVDFSALVDDGCDLEDRVEGC